MVIKAFPPIETANEYGLVAVGGDLEIESLLLAYKSGIFPWPMHPEHLTWFSLDPRAILFLDNFHIPKSLKKDLKKYNFEFKINSNFEDVIKNCSEVTNRKDDGTWITDEIIEAYINLHKAGYAYSVETYLDNKLVGGLYGVSINGMIAGESMFHHIDSASKAALIYLIEYLKNKDVTFIDCQMMTPLFENFGAIDIPRKEFIHLLNQSLKQEKLF